MALEVIAKSDLNRYSGERNGIMDAGERAAVFENDHVVPCPMARAEIPVSRCPDCQHFQSIGTVRVSGSDPEAPKRFRVMCQHPWSRPLLRSTMPIEESYRKVLLSAIAVREEATQKNQDLERRVFVEESFGVNCPMARAKIGVWRVERPPCPACEHYKGFDPLAGRPAIMCDHARTIRFRRPLNGSFLV